MKSASKTDQSPAEEESFLSYRESLGSLAQDWIVRGICIALVLASLPLLFPILSDEWLSTYGRRLLEPPFLVALLVSIRYRMRSVEDPSERRYWNLLTLGFTFWLLTLMSGVIADNLLADSEALRLSVKNGPYLLFYAALAAALELHSHGRDDPTTRPLQILNWAGSFILLLGLLAYFLAAPSFMRDSSSGFWASSLALFVAIDAYIILRVSHLRETAASYEWKWIYTWLLIGATIWGFGDLMLLLMFEQILTDPEWGTVFDLIWPLSFAAVVVATRATDSQPITKAKVTPVKEKFRMGPLVVYASAPLLLHVVLYRFGMPEPEFRLIRDVLVLELTAVLVAMALLYHRYLTIENDRIAAKNAKTKEDLAHQAFHDELTGLPNRNLFRDRLQLAIASSVRSRRKCAVLFCDLDQFKVINDSLGHDAGDQALVATAERLQASIRKRDTVARFGGDEFAVIAENLQQALDAAFLAEKILTAISAPLVLGRKSHVLTASIGIAVYPDDGEDEEALLKHADTAMYQAKLHGRNSYRLFTQAMNEAAKERLTIERGLKAGLIEDQFEVFYQPIVDLETGQPVAYEALLRWNHPERGYITPVSFIDVAEQTGLIVPIGMWVLETACKWAAQLKPVGDVSPCISVNMSPRQFREPELVQGVAEILKRTGLDPSRLQLEIAESIAFDSPSDTLSEMRELGVRIAIDGFGTGYAALSLLQDVSVDIVKIGRSFVKGIEVGSVSEAIVLAIVNMARALDFYVVAEGVESESEMSVIRQSKCDAVQGYYLCAPLPSQELEQWIAEEGSKGLKLR